MYAWKTIPIPRLTRLTSTSRRVISSPWSRIRPASTFSSRLTQRRRVDLPEPEAPIRQTTSCSATSRSTPSSTSFSPNDFRISSSRRALPFSLTARPPRLALPLAGDQPVGQARERNRQEDEEDRRTDVRRVVERRRYVDLRLAKRLNRADQRDQRRVLLRPMKSFRSGGITRRTACGTITNRSVLSRESPSDRAAASWLECTDSIPAR